ncbi:MAG: hypothetical protein WCS51_02245 [Bacilli bacterium]|jgi:hypothetical protein
MDFRIVYAVFLALGIVVGGFACAFEYVIYQQTGSKKYNFLRNFPYELNQFHLGQKKSFILFGVEIISGLCFVASMVFASIYLANNRGNPTSAYVFFVVATLIIISFFILRFTKLTNYKGHLVFATINVVLNLLLLLLYYFFFTNKNYQYVVDTGVRVFEIIFILILILFEFFLMINPTYKNWAKMVKMDAEVYSRPKYCYLPILEWGNVLVYLLANIPLLFVLFF